MIGRRLAAPAIDDLPIEEIRSWVGQKINEQPSTNLNPGAVLTLRAIVDKEQNQLLLVAWLVYSPELGSIICYNSYRW